jgi:hypothetical protein
MKLTLTWFTDTFPTALQTYCVSDIKTTWSALCKEVTAVYHKAHKKINALCGNIAKFLNV